MFKERNVGIDLFRCLCIYGICVYHAFFTGGFANGYESRIWTWCVPGFSFISGYYGVTLRISKLVSLWVVASICFILPIMLGGNYFELLFTNWYLLAYTILMLLSPIINAGLNIVIKNDFRFAIGGMMLLAIWSWLSEFALTRSYVPRPNGLGALSFCSVIVAYTLGFFYRNCSKVREKVKYFRGKFYLFVALILLSALFGHYTSPVTLLIVVILFCLFERMKFNAKASKIITTIASTGFAVYVLHANWQVLSFMHELSGYFIHNCNFPRYIGLMISAFVICITCVAIYFLGYIMFLPINAKFRKFCIGLI